MKIYFEDGRLKDFNLLTFKFDGKIDAKDGCSDNINSLNEWFAHSPKTSVIYTNSIIALDNKYCWNADLKIPELYIRAGENYEFVRIDKLTDRELREAHNLMHMYLSGCFNK